VNEGNATIQALLDAMAAILPEIEVLIGVVDFFDNDYEDNGFLSYWAEYGVANGIQYTKDVLSNMNAVLSNDFDNNGTSEVEELIGTVDFFDNDYEDNGFITYWAQEAVSNGAGVINQGLYIWKRLLPHVEAREGRNLNLFIGDDAGILSFWMNEVLKLINEEGLELEEAIQKIIDKLSGGQALASFLYDTSEKILQYFQEGAGIDLATGLPYSWISFTEDDKVYQPNYTSITDIGMHIISLVSLYKLDKLTAGEFNAALTQLINSLYSLQTYSPEKGEFAGKMYFFNYYELPSKTATFNKFISSIDNTNLVMALILAREAAPVLANDLNELINKIDLGFFYDDTAHLFYGGYDYNDANETVTPSNFHYGILNTETRLISYLAIGKGDISGAEATLHWQTLARNKINVYGIDVIASYGGSLFEFLFPSLFIDEAQLSPDGFGLNFKKAVLIQKLQAIENGYPFWGEAPCYNSIYEYGEFGSPAGVNPYPTEGILSPYTLLLSLNATGEGGDLLTLLENMYPGSIQSEFGLIDAIDADNDLGIYLNSTLLQGIALAAIANNLNNSIRGLFMGSAEFANIAELIQNETFFTETEINAEMDNVYNLINDNIAQNKWEEARVLFDYLKDLITTYNQEARFPNLNQLETQVNNLFTQELENLYQEGKNQLTASRFSDAIKIFQKVLYYDTEYKDTEILLTQARILRNDAIVIPNMNYLVTTFEEGMRPNSIVQKIGPVDGPNGSIDIGIVENTPEHGKVMRLQYQLQPGGFNGMYLITDNLNLSSTNKLKFDIKGDAGIGIPDKIKIELCIDGINYSFEIDNITGDWQTIEINLGDLLPLLPANFELEQIAIIFEGDNVGNNQGAIYIDNIGFN
ncbi:MAG: glucoamylase family protein, partial [Candidatus Kaelpia imicola]|nr:glucoamylase family protein [Candidatus Kaelpia imicola]